MTRPTMADIQRWSEEVARDPGSLAFVPLAQSYRRSGHRDPAIRLLLRGLERHPEHAEGHALLARLYLETGERLRAVDEWATVIRLDPGNFEALRGLGFNALERGDFDAARRHLGAAADQRPEDSAVGEALALTLARARAAAEAVAPAAPAEPPPAEPEFVEPAQEQGHSAEPEALPPAEAAPTVNGSPADVDFPFDVEPVSPFEPETAFEPESAFEPEAEPEAEAEAEAENVAETEPWAAPAFQPQPQPQPASNSREPSRIFEPLLGEPLFRWALLADSLGLVLGWTQVDPATDAEELGAWIGGVAAEASRCATHLRIGDWSGLLLETDREVIHLVRPSDGLLVILGAVHGAPAGWVVRIAERAAEIALQYAGDGR